MGSPRTSVAIATLAGMNPATIAWMVLTGKIALYTSIVLLLQRLPQVLRTLVQYRETPIIGRIHRPVRRLAALQRLIMRSLKSAGTS